MSSFNPLFNIFPNKSGDTTNNYITVQMTAELTGYNIQYLRRLLCSKKLEGIKIGQIWLIDFDPLEKYLRHGVNSSDRRIGPRSNFIQL